MKIRFFIFSYIFLHLFLAYVKKKIVNGGGGKNKNYKWLPAIYHCSASSRKKENNNNGKNSTTKICPKKQEGAGGGVWGVYNAINMNIKSKIGVKGKYIFIYIWFKQITKKNLVRTKLV